MKIGPPKKTELSITNELQTYLHAATSNNTRKAYQQDIRHFMSEGGLLPATTCNLLTYLQQQASRLKPQTLKRRLTAIKHWHTYQGFPDPTSHPIIRKALSGIARVHGKPTVKAAALSLDQLRKISEYLKHNESLSNVRNRALILIGFFAALRRSELVGLCWEHIHFEEQGVTITIPRSKTDQEGEGQNVAIPYGKTELCPVKALQQWQNISKRDSGAIFCAINKHQRMQSKSLTALSVNHILKKLAHETQLPNPQTYSGHSLRRGFATTASQNGVSMIAIMRQGRWRHEGTVYGYIEEGQRFVDNAASYLLQK
ncbi:MAG: site-specific integrase [Candidatus Berkiella sp.]